MLVLSYGYTRPDANVENEISILRALFGTCDVMVLRLISCLELNEESLDDMVAVHVHHQVKWSLFQKADHLS